VRLEHTAPRRTGIYQMPAGARRQLPITAGAGDTFTLLYSGWVTGRSLLLVLGY